MSYLDHLYTTHTYIYILIYYDNPAILHLFADLPNVHAAGGVVHTPVTGKTAAIFEEVLKRRDPQHKHHRDHGDLLAECIDRRHPIKQHNEDEVQIGHTVELLQQIAR